MKIFRLSAFALRLSRHFALLLLCAAAALPVDAQESAKYGLIHYDALFLAMPEHAEARQNLEQLRSQYDAEARYNETAFNRQFAEYLQGQNNFSENIMLKRQKDLQDAMEKGLAFRAASDSLLQKAERDIYAPVHKKLRQAIAQVGRERGYELIVNLDAQAFPFVKDELCEDADAFVKEKLKIND